MKKKLIGILFGAFVLVIVIAVTVLGGPQFNPRDNKNDKYLEPIYDSNKSIVSLGDRSYLFFRLCPGRDNAGKYNSWEKGYRGETIGALVFTNKGNGQLVYDSEKTMATDKVVERGGNGLELEACAYRDKIYVFYDTINPDPYRWVEREINYKCIKNGEKSWSDQITIKNGIRAGFGRHTKRLLMTASVMDDKLFLSYKCGEDPKSSGCLMYNGDKWVEVNKAGATSPK